MDLTRENERALVFEAKQGDTAALAALLQANYAIVLRTLVKLTLDARAAEDATQDAMERAIRHIQSFDPDKARFSTWLITIARNRWLDVIRKNRRAARSPGDETMGAHDPFTALIERDALLAALRRMDPKARSTVTMSYLMGYSHEEIARVMGIPLGTVKSRISNAIKRLKKELG